MVQIWNTTDIKWHLILKSVTRFALLCAYPFAALNVSFNPRRFVLGTGVSRDRQRLVYKLEIYLAFYFIYMPRKNLGIPFTVASDLKILSITGCLQM